MSDRVFHKVSGVIFVTVAVLHGVRIYLGLDAVIGNIDIPLWVSWVAVVLAGYLGLRALFGRS